MKKNKSRAWRPLAHLGSPALDWSSQLLGGFAQVMPNAPAYFLIACHGWFCFKKKKVVGASDRILAVGFVNKLRRAWWWNLMEERDSGYLFQGGWFG